MNEHQKKMIAPIVITAIVIIYYIVYFCLIMSVTEGIIRFLFGLIPLGIAGVMIYVCIQRIHEIDEGEEDDLSKY